MQQFYILSTTEQLRKQVKYVFKFKLLKPFFLFLLLLTALLWQPLSAQVKEFVLDVPNPSEVQIEGNHAYVTNWDSNNSVWKLNLYKLEGENWNFKNSFTLESGFSFMEASENGFSQSSEHRVFFFNKEKSQSNALEYVDDYNNIFGIGRIDYKVNPNAQLLEIAANKDRIAFLERDIRGTGDYEGFHVYYNIYIYEYNGETWEKTYHLPEHYFFSQNDFEGAGKMVIAGNKLAFIGEDPQSVYIYELKGKTWVQTGHIEEEMPSHYDDFARDISLDENRLLITTNEGYSLIYEYNGSKWIKAATLTSPNFRNGVWYTFNYSNALSGNLAAFTAYTGMTTPNPELISVFENDGNQWNEKLTISLPNDNIINFDLSGKNLIALVNGKAIIYSLTDFSVPEFDKVTANDGSKDDYLGYATSIWQTRAVVGAYRDKDHGYDSGSAYIYERDGLNWVQTKKLTASDANSTDRFGISIDNKENLIVVGAPLNDDDGNASGSAYIYMQEGTTWRQNAKLTASDATSKDRFGYSVAITSDPENTYDDEFQKAIAVVGAPYADGKYTNTGAIYVFDFERFNYPWTEQFKLVPNDARTGDKFGWSVAVDGRRIVAASTYDDDNGRDSGSIYVFEFDGSSWTQTAKLKPADGKNGDRFGISVALDGDRIIAGANLKDSDNAGAAYIFELKSGKWQQTAKLTAFDKNPKDRFGTSVSIWGDKAVVGSPYADHKGGTNAGAAYVYQLENGSWELERKITGDARTGDYLGKSVDIFGDHIIAGAHLDDDKGKDAGAAYIFNLLNSDNASMARWENVAEEKTTMMEPNEAEDFSSDDQKGMGTFPNPFEEQFTISFENPVSGKVTIELMNQLGVVVYQETRTLSETQYSMPVDLGTLPDKGILFLRVSAGNETVQFSKIIRQ